MSWNHQCKACRIGLRVLFALILVFPLLGCESNRERVQLSASDEPENRPEPNYRIGPGDGIQIFVWRNNELSMSVPVRPDGKISTPLVEDLQAAGKTPTQLARDIEEVLSIYVKSPVVTIIVNGFNGPFSDQIRVLGEATSPTALSYKENMSLLDVMIAVNGLTTFADGNNAVLVRNVDGKQVEYGVRLSDLIKNGDISANAKVYPGDILIIPEALF